MKKNHIIHGSLSRKAIDQMEDDKKTENQIINELAELRRQVANMGKLAAERRGAEEALNESEERYRKLFEVESDAILLVDYKTGRILDANTSAVKLYGYKLEEFLLLNVTDVSAEPEKTLQSIATHETQIPIRWHRKKDGAVFPVEIAGSYFDHQGGTIHVAAIRDVSERKRVEDLMHVRLLLNEYATNRTLAELLQLTIDEAERLTGSRIGFFHFLDADQNTISLQMWSTNTLKNMCSAKGKGEHYSVDMAGVWVDCVLQRRSVIHNDYASLTNRRGMPEGHAPLVRELVVPVFRNDLIVAILGLGNKPHEYDKEDAAITLQLADLAWDIVMRKTAEEALKRSEEQYRELVETANSIILKWDTEGNITFLNDYAERFFGFSKGELLGKNVVGTIVPMAESSGRDLEQLMEGIRKDPDRFANNENENIRKDGQRVWIQWANKAIMDDCREVTGILSIGHDATQRKKAEDAVLKAKEEWERTFDASSDPIMIIGTDYRIQRANKAMAELIGLTVDDAVGMICYEHVHNSKFPLMSCPHSKLLKDGKSYTEEIYEPHIGKHLLVTVSPMLDNGGNLIGSVHYAKDITDRKIAEASLLESEKLLRTIIDSEPECVKLLSHDGLLITMNPAGLAMIQAESLDQVKGQNVCSLVAPEDRQTFTDLNEDVFKGKSGRLEFKMVGLKGRYLWVETNAVPLRNGQGVIIASLGITRDITERKRAEEGLRRSEEFVRRILDTVDEGFIVIDRNFRIMTANSAYCRQIGILCQEVTGKHCYEISHNSLTPCYEDGEDCAVQHVFETGKPHSALHRHKSQDGSIIYVETKAFPLKDENGVVISAIETLNNITEKHLLEEERLKTQKLEAIGILAGGIAHDFNNLLQGLFGCISAAKLNKDQPDKVLTMLAQAEKALEMSVSLTSQLLTFSRGGKPVKKKFALQSLIENSVQFALSGSSSDCRINIDKNLWAVDADEGQIGQVIQNIVLNANQAMPDGGTVEISARNANISRWDNSMLPDGGKFVEIVIKDSGVGVPEQYLSRIFDPYFTTKQKGSGLGLATSYSIVRNHNGTIDVKSQAGKGSTFSIYLPASENGIEEVTQAPASITGQKGRILVMDDEEILRVAMVAMLESLGHEVTCVEDGQEAIAKFSQAIESGKPFDIVVLDLTVKGGMGGEQTIKRLLQIDPNIKAVVSSGYADNPIMSEYGSYGFSAFLIKPYKIEVLRDSLNSLLGLEY